MIRRVTISRGSQDHIPGDRFIDAITEQLEAWLWSPKLDNLPQSGQLLVRVVRFLYAIIRDVISGNFTLRAAGLVYVTILSIVPVLAIVFSIMKGFGVHRQLEPLLYNFLAPLGAKGAELTEQVIGFVDNVQGNVLAGAGLILLFFTTISMAQKVEDSFNFVWRVDQSRSIAQRITEYLSLILIVPVVMVTAIALLASFRSTAIVQELESFQAVSETVLVIGKLAPYGMIVLLFTVAYWFLPNTRVRFFPALMGGLAGGLLWVSAGGLFTAFVVSSTRTLSIYATFAIVIMALIWLYLSWLILLVGALVSFYVQNPQHLRLGYRPVSLGSRQREQTALGLMLSAAKAFREGARQPTTGEVAESAGLPTLVVLPVLQRLVAAKLLNRTSKDQLYPQRDPATIRLIDIINAVRDPQVIDIFTLGKWPTVVRDVSKGMDAALDEDLGDRNVYDLLDGGTRQEKSSVDEKDNPVAG
ncbi:MAG: YihY family inner membrane protein [Gammaproteobacteria bacterium]|nr:YihY family inner membrane protein [Gammaproteobacteria bacterium]